ncbi:MAG: pilus assembly protein [Cellvibrionaceae bacterium]|nr:pilus assembly protein [Cellvibrionaceae bacterium]
MIDKRKINLTSLNLVREELVSTIEQAATQLEGFVSDRENIKILDACFRSLQQIRGSLDLIELHGACELAGELLSTAQRISEGDAALEDEKLSALTRGFFVLSCYLDYVLQKQRGMPVVLIPYINDIRIANRQAIMPESYFTQATTGFRLPVNTQADPIPEGESLEGMARRFRHMYQVGLLGVIKEVRIPVSLQLMQRGVDKLSRYLKGTPTETLWWLLSHCLQAMATAEMDITLTRKRMLGQMDREFRKIEKLGDHAFSQAIAEDKLKELAYYIALADLDQPECKKITAAFGYDALDYNEGDRKLQVKNLTGPSTSTVLSVVETLKEELLSVKEVIEFSAESATTIIDGYDELIASMAKIREILDVVGLKVASETMAEQLKKIQQWKASEEQLDGTDLVYVADAFLYIESVLNSIEKRNFSDEKLDEVNQLSRTQVMMTTQLDDAKLIVLEEAEAGLNMVKRALSAFSDSSYDRVHIKNIAKTLSSVRGGLIVLELNRAAAVVAACSQFVEDSLLSTNQPAAIEHMLETFADALMCLEYYLDCMKVDKYISSDTLVVAEESLAALGYGVSYSEKKGEQ